MFSDAQCLTDSGYGSLLASGISTEQHKWKLKSSRKRSVAVTNSNCFREIVYTSFF
mgnify:FL=1